MRGAWRQACSLRQVGLTVKSLATFALQFYLPFLNPLVTYTHSPVTTARPLACPPACLQMVGKFAEKRDPSLACVAYKRGQCDEALVECTAKNAMFKLQASKHAHMRALHALHHALCLKLLSCKANACVHGNRSGPWRLWGRRD